MIKPKISILHTGGTIASKVDYETGAVVAKFEPEELYALYPELKELAYFHIVKVANIMSEDADFGFINKLALAVKEEIKNGADGIIITHGTDTMHYTAAALHFMLECVPVPVVLVGAQRSSDRPSSDAGMNLICASHFIIKSGCKCVGICMHENQNDEFCIILPGEKARKMHSSRRDAFQSPEPLARVNYLTGAVEVLREAKQSKQCEDKSQVQQATTKEEIPEALLQSLKTTREFKVNFINEKIRVGLIKVYPSFEPKILEQFKDYDGLLIEGTGLGHVPKNCLSEIEKLIKNGCKVVMATQTIFGRVNMNVYSRGRELINLGVDGNYNDLPPESAFMKMVVELSKK